MRTRNHQTQTYQTSWLSLSVSRNIQFYTWDNMGLGLWLIGSTATCDISIITIIVNFALYEYLRYNLYKATNHISLFEWRV